MEYRNAIIEAAKEAIEEGAVILRNAEITSRPKPYGIHDNIRREKTLADLLREYSK